MLRINTKFHNGIMFILLDGRLTKSEVYKFRKEITNIISENKIRKVVYDLSNLKYIDKYGINILYMTNNINEKSLVCNLKESLKDKLKKYNFDIVKNELEALRLC